MAANDNVRRVRQAYEALRRGDSDRFAELLDPAIDWYAVEGLGLRPCRNRDEVLGVIRDQAPHFDLGAVEILGDGERVVVSAPAPGRPPFDSLPEGRVYTVLEMARGRVVRMQDYARRADALGGARISEPA